MKIIKKKVLKKLPKTIKKKPMVSLTTVKKTKKPSLALNLPTSLTVKTQAPALLAQLTKQRQQEINQIRKAWKQIALSLTNLIN